MGLRPFFSCCLFLLIVPWCCLATEYVAVSPHQEYSKQFNAVPGSYSMSLLVMSIVAEEAEMNVTDLNNRALVSQPYNDLLAGDLLIYTRVVQYYTLCPQNNCSGLRLTVSCEGGCFFVANFESRSQAVEAPFYGETQRLSAPNWIRVEANKSSVVTFGWTAARQYSFSQRDLAIMAWSPPEEPHRICQQYRLASNVDCTFEVKEGQPTYVLLPVGGVYFRFCGETDECKPRCPKDCYLSGYCLDGECHCGVDSWGCNIYTFLLVTEVLAPQLVGLFIVVVLVSIEALFGCCCKRVDHRLQRHAMHSTVVAAMVTVIFYFAVMAMRPTEQMQLSVKLAGQFIVGNGELPREVSESFGFSESIAVDLIVTVLEGVHQLALLATLLYLLVVLLLPRRHPRAELAHLGIFAWLAQWIFSFATFILPAVLVGGSQDPQSNRYGGIAIALVFPYAVLFVIMIMWSLVLRYKRKGANLRILRAMLLTICYNAGNLLVFSIVALKIEVAAVWFGVVVDLAFYVFLLLPSHLLAYRGDTDHLSDDPDDVAQNLIQK